MMSIALIVLGVVGSIILFVVLAVVFAVRCLPDEYVGIATATLPNVAPKAAIQVCTVALQHICAGLLCSSQH